MAATANKHLPCHCAIRRGALGACLALGFMPPAQALDWKFESGVDASATYTDNVRQSVNKDDAFILRVTPEFTLQSEGSRRVQAMLQYGLSGVARLGDSTRNNNNDLFHNLNAAGKAELVEDFLFIEGNARISQELISLLGSPSSADVNSSNRANVGTYSISPYVQKRLGTFANAKVRYTASGAVFESQTTADSSVNAFNADLVSGTRFNDFSWGLNYFLRKAENRNAAIVTANADTTFERASATVGYAMTRKFRVFGTVGQDWNDYLSTTETSGSFYSVGFGWAPTRRTSIEASAGERYFGSSYSVAGSHRTRMSRWTVRYFEDVSDITQQFLLQSNRIFWDCGGVLEEATDTTNPNPGRCVGPYTAGQLANMASQLGYTNEQIAAMGFGRISSANGVYIIKSFSAGVNWDIGRLALGLSAQDTRRLYQLFGDAEDSVQGVTGSINYRMSPKTTAFSSLSLTRTHVDGLLNLGVTRDDDLVSLSLGLNHRFAEDLSGALVLRHTERDSNVATADYTENRLTATVNMRF